MKVVVSTGAMIRQWKTWTAFLTDTAVGNGALASVDTSNVCLPSPHLSVSVEGFTCCPNHEGEEEGEGVVLSCIAGPSAHSPSSGQRTSLVDLLSLSTTCMRKCRIAAPPCSLSDTEDSVRCSFHLSTASPSPRVKHPNPDFGHTPGTSHVWPRQTFDPRQVSLLFDIEVNTDSHTISSISPCFQVQACPEPLIPPSHSCFRTRLGVLRPL